MIVSHPRVLIIEVIIMKKHLLTLLLAVFAVTVMAQTTPETALELKGGANEYEPTTTGETYWKYTAEENVLVKFTGLSGVSACKLDDSGAEVTLNGVSSYSDPYPFYLPVGEGETVYFKAYVYQPVTFEAAINPYANYGRPGTKYEEMAHYRLMRHDLEECTRNQ